MAVNAAGDQPDQLELRVPLALVAFISLPAVLLWVLTGALAAAGDAIAAVFLVGAVATSAMVIRIGRVGATVGIDGVEVRTLGRTRRLDWRDVDGFSVLRQGRGMLLVTTVDGESLAMVGVPSRRYRRRHDRTGDVLADLRRRLESARRASGGGSRQAPPPG